MTLQKTLLAAVLCLTPLAAQAQPGPERRLVRVDVVDGGAVVFAPRIVMAVGATASAAKAGAYEVVVTLSALQAGTPVTHIVLNRLAGGERETLLSRDIAASLDAPVTLRAPRTAGSDKELTLEVGVSRYAPPAPAAAAQP